MRARANLLCQNLERRHNSQLWLIDAALASMNDASTIDPPGSRTTGSVAATVARTAAGENDPDPVALPADSAYPAVSRD